MVQIKKCKISVPPSSIATVTGEGSSIYRPLGYERVYLPLCKVAGTHFHIEEDYIIFTFGIYDYTTAMLYSMYSP